MACAPTNRRSTVQAVTVETGSRDEDGRLVLVNDRLLAVLVRLERDEGVEPEFWGRWFLEAGFGPYGGRGSGTILFVACEEAQIWACEQVERRARASSAR